MNSHISIEVEGSVLTLPQDQSIDIEEQNPLFHDNEMHSYPIQLPFDYNRHFFGNIDDTNSHLRAVDVEGKNARILIDGLPIRNVTPHIQEDETLVDKVSINFDSRRKTFKDLIKDLKCRDVPVDDNILIGEKIGNVEVSFRYNNFYHLEGAGLPPGALNFEDTDYKYVTQSFEPPATGFSYPGKCTNGSSPYYDATIEKTIDFDNNHHVNVPKVYDSYINVLTPYGSTDSKGKRWPYCNSRICYAHHDIDESGKTTEDIVPSDKANYSLEYDRSPYWVLPADRPASGICFYVAYFLERLFKHLNMDYDISALTDIEDFNYLSFFTTSCKYDTGSTDYFQLSDKDKINKWLNDRGCGGQIDFDVENKGKYTSVQEATFKVFNTQTGQYETCHVVVNQYCYIPGRGNVLVLFIGTKPIIDVQNVTATARIQNMYANSDNFPDSDVSTIIESIEKSFGVRFLYDSEINKVTACLYKDVFRQINSSGVEKTPIHLNAHINTMYKMTEKITGVRMKYSKESDIEEQYRNIKYGIRNYDTDYDYIDYPEKRTVVDKTYTEISQKVDSGDMNVYVIPATGNAIRVKVDEDATTEKDLKPVMFEVGQFKGVEIGDCSKENDDNGYVHEIVSDFQPILVNDVNYRNGGGMPGYQPMLVPYVDVDMEHEFTECRLQNIIKTEYADVYFNYILRHYESFDPSKTDDGQSPLQNHDWGLTIGILRTGDGGEGIEKYEPNYDGFGNWKWKDIADNYCIAADTMDQTGLRLGKTDEAKTFSLKIRAWKPFVYYLDDSGNIHINKNVLDAGRPVEGVSGKVWLIPCDDDVRNSVTGNITRRLRSRGLLDTFMSEYIYFLLNRFKYKISAIVEIAQLADIRNHWLDYYEIDGKIGYIDKYKYYISSETGLGEVEIDFFAI